MSYELIELGRRRIIVQKGEPTFIDAATKSRSKEVSMRGNIKKLVLLTIISVMAPFILSATLSAAPRFLHGQYAATTTESCVTAFCGFAANGVPNGAGEGLWLVSTGSHNAYYTFARNGTGRASGTVVTNFDYNPILPTVNTPNSGLVTWSYSFTYTINSTTGAITINVYKDSLTYEFITGPYATTPPTVTTVITDPLIYTGTVSLDGYTIIINGSNTLVRTISPNILTTCGPSQQICGGSTVMTLQ
jgi:hypothetical protein